MECLLLFALLGSSPTPYEAIEAWDPNADSTQTSPPALPNDNGTQALSALKLAVGGVALGVGSATAAVLVGAMAASATGGLFGAAFYIAGAVTAIIAFVAAPAVTVAVFAGELPGWTPWLTAGAVVIGSAVGILAGGVAANTYVNARSPPGSDCRLCGADTMLAAFGLPVLGGAVGAVLGSVSSTTIGAFAE